MTVDRGHRETLLNGLVPDAYYRVQVTAVSEFGIGRPSKSIYAKVTAAQMGAFNSFASMSLCIR